VEEETLRALEFDKVRSMVVERAATRPGKARASRMRPQTDPDRVSREQDLTSEAVWCLEKGERPPLAGVHEVERHLRRCRKGGTLGVPELLDVVQTLEAARRTKRYIREVSERCPGLWSIAAAIEPRPDVEDEIRRCVGPPEEVLDGASARLAQLRRGIRSLEGRVRDALESLIRSPSLARYLQEPLVTVRQGRYVVPVKQEYSRRVKGIVHDRSASGATVFMEPLSVVEANNRIREARAAESREVERVLGKLSSLVASAADAVSASLDATSELDVVFARAAYSLDVGGTRPRTGRPGAIDLRNARHPLLKGHVVPIDVRVGDDFSVLVLTGPNTGGKTVTLKTVGLCALMAQAGLQVPADEGSEIAVFQKVFADIGDEQSIEQSLSTFSSHMRNIVRFVEEAGERSLVLIDEIGAGTDPMEGAALAMGLLEHFRRVGATTVATTHYSELKAFAYSHPGVENASVEFDVQTLMPTYKVHIGMPGRSNAFEIAARLGLRDAVVKRARELVKPRDAEVSSLIGDIAEEKRRIEREAAALREERRRAEEARRRAESAGEELAERARARLEKANAEARDIVRSARREADEVIGELRSLLECVRGGAPAPDDMDRMVARSRARLAEARRRAARGLKRWALRRPPGEAVSPDELTEGRTVYVSSLRRRGVVVSQPDGSGMVQVRSGSIRARVPASDLSSVADEGERRPAQDSAHRISVEKAAGVSPEVSVRGMTVDEAIAKVEKYVDDAFLAGLEEVRIIHGKGTGTLRAAVREYLERHPQVRLLRAAEPKEGGEGVTVAVLDR